MSAIPIVALVGATATGKTALGESLAEALGAEIVCADSRQVYRELEIGTGKPAPAERAARPHHLFDARSIRAPASAGAWAREAAAACAAIRGRGRTPLLVGGSGLYLKALMAGLAAIPPHDPAVRARLAAEARAAGIEALHARLALADPASAARLRPRDTQRVLRALEVIESTGRPLSAWLGRPAEPLLAGPWRVIELTLPAAVLGERIEHRTRAMFDQGLAEETAALVARGLAEALARLATVGYDEALALLDGRLDRAGAEARTNRRTRQLAKRQRTWFRHQVDAARLDGEAGPRALLAAALAAARGRAPFAESD